MLLTIPPSSTWRRLAAALGVALVLFLSVLAVRPDWHESLCRHEAKATACSHAHHHGPASAQPGGEHEAGSDGEACVVALFAQGHLLAALFIALLLALVVVAHEWAATGRGLALAAVDVEWPHGCGPPAA